MDKRILTFNSGTRLSALAKTYSRDDYNMDYILQKSRNNSESEEQDAYSP